MTPEVMRSMDWALPKLAEQVDNGFPCNSGTSLTTAVPKYHFHFLSYNIQLFLIILDLALADKAGLLDNISPLNYK